MRGINVLWEEGAFFMELPEDLRYAIELELSAISYKELAKLAAELSDRYRADKPSAGGSFIKSQRDIDAYVAFRMPATFAAVYSALNQVMECLPNWSPQTLLDVGAGPGTALWAALSVYPDLNAATLIEREEGMIRLGKRLGKYSSSTVIQEAKWVEVDITANDWKTFPHDIVTASYVLGELDEKHRSDFIRKLWQLTKGVMIIIEPGTPAGFSRIRQARKQLISEGGIVIAPCPHNLSCPITDDDWCHFSQRISRSRLHRQVKSAELSYEDEKFSFIAVSRNKGEAVLGRVLRHPHIRKGHIKFQVCSLDGIRNITITRKDKELYRTARKLKWGSIFPFKQ